MSSPGNAPVYITILPSRDWTEEKCVEFHKMLQECDCMAALWNTDSSTTLGWSIPVSSHNQPEYKVIKDRARERLVAHHGHNWPNGLPRYDEKTCPVCRAERSSLESRR